MFRTFTMCLVSCAALAFLVVIPLRDAINIDALGRPLAVRELPPLPAAHDIFQCEWWRDPERILAVRNMYTNLTDEQFLCNYKRHKEAYDHIDAALRAARVSQEAAPCELSGAPNELPDAPL